ncbi:hypothetical protein U9M48_036480 [Paspalum notatum var. saurae]|uniref:Uncharacterized protein n=1 Tax=Paspalum notatum var. saurae TaxID=547442 RepID=A0AAQ3UD83_PASNO
MWQTSLRSSQIRDLLLARIRGSLGVGILFVYFFSIRSVFFVPRISFAGAGQEQFGSIDCTARHQPNMSDKI